MNDTTAVSKTAGASRIRVVLAALFLIVALLALVACTQPTPVVTPSTPAATPAPSVAATTPAPSVAATTSALPAGLTEEAAKDIYAQQIESRANITHLAKGEVSSISADKVVVTGTDANVSITAKFSDGTQSPGTMRFVQRGGAWYFFSITGLRPDSVGGLAESTNDAKALEASRSAATVLAQNGFTTIDMDIVKTIATQQSENQAIVAQLMDGTVNMITMSAPQAGTGTTTVPITVSGAKGLVLKGSLVLVNKTIDGKDLSFVTGFKKQ